MREIKFRCFGKQEWNAKMRYDISFLKYGEGWQGGNPAHKFYEVHFGNEGFMRVDADQLYIMQYIGLKDKNDKEMYESDICKIHFYHDPNLQPAIGIIEWMSDASFCIRGCKNSDSIYNPRFKSGGDFGDYPAIEVIGNIYENPELLKIV